MGELETAWGAGYLDRYFRMPMVSAADHRLVECYFENPAFRAPSTHSLGPPGPTTSPHVRVVPAKLSPTPGGPAAQLALGHPPPSGRVRGSAHPGRAAGVVATVWWARV